MIEKIGLEYLQEAVQTPCYMEVPADEPAEAFIVIEKIGSGRANQINSASFAIQSYAPTLYEAAELNDAVKAAMLEIICLDDIARVFLDSDYVFNNTATKSRRYQAIFDLTYY